MLTLGLDCSTRFEETFSSNRDDIVVINVYPRIALAITIRTTLTIWADFCCDIQRILSQCPMDVMIANIRKKPLSQIQLPSR